MSRRPSSYRRLRKGALSQFLVGPWCRSFQTGDYDTYVNSLEDNQGAVFESHLLYLVSSKTAGVAQQLASIELTPSSPGSRRPPTSSTRTTPRRPTATCWCIILVYVDDLLVVGDDSIVGSVRAAIKRRFPVTEGGSDYLSMEIERGLDFIRVHQATYAGKVLRNRSRRRDTPPPRRTPGSPSRGRARGRRRGCRRRSHARAGASRARVSPCAS